METSPRERIKHYAEEARSWIGDSARDLRERTRRLRAERRESEEERLRSGIRRAVSHPSAIEVSFGDDGATVRGALLLADLQRLAEKLSANSHDFTLQLEVRKHADVPALEGPSRWLPAKRTAAVAAGATLAALGFSQGQVGGWIAGLVGLGLAMRGLTNRGIRDLRPRRALQAAQA